MKITEIKKSGDEIFSTEIYSVQSGIPKEIIEIWNDERDQAIDLIKNAAEDNTDPLLTRRSSHVYSFYVQV